MSSGKGEGQPRTKVGRLIEEYDLGAGYGAELEAAWTGEEGERSSLRELAARVNTDVLEATMAATGGSAWDREVQATYRNLTDEGVSTGTRTEIRRRLEREDVDVERLERDFVTYQAVRSYLKDVRGAEYEPNDGDSIERTAESIGRLRTRLERVAESNLDRLAETNRLALGEFRLFVGAEVLCEDCGSQYAIEDLLERGGCECMDAG